jgi:hypothetical protein
MTAAVDLHLSARVSRILILFAFQHFYFLPDCVQMLLRDVFPNIQRRATSPTVPQVAQAAVSFCGFASTVYAQLKNLLIF